MNKFRKESTLRNYSSALKELLYGVWIKFLQTLFFFFLLSLFFIDLLIFPHLKDWSSLSLLIIEMILLLFMGRICHIDYLEVLTDKIIAYNKDQ
ncbi:hypothetical protein Cva_00855 [Caedimonas varicaedens]|uniref:Uncharacterized protein n=1 Tax=Caedimonas varicaedens TaxID=1629334 RepID=A0A0K8MCL3_9PROT|nr:hypothetical protein Cva_00855 [Caedimonas varicaedens]